MKQPNVVFVFSDQHREDAAGYTGNSEVMTPNLDALSHSALNFTMAVSNVPCCCPYRATLMTGQYPLTHGVFLNDVHLEHKAVSIADAFQMGGYDTAYIGKWHLNGRGRGNFIPKEDRQGFDYWKVLECTHNYNESYYYENDDIKQKWDGYDAKAQSQDAQQYIRSCSGKDKPFFLVLSWGPPHNPYETAPQVFKEMYDPKNITLRPNVPQALAEKARTELAGYYAHITALDSYVGDLLGTLKEEGLENNTIFVYTSDHGDMLWSQGEPRKQRPWDESIRVPFLLRYPLGFESIGKQYDFPFNSPDIMPTLLGLCGLPVPSTAEGMNHAPFLRGEHSNIPDAALIQCIQPCGEYTREVGGREYRGIRTQRYTYVRDLSGPWLLYDNKRDPYQLNNFCNDPDQQQLQAALDQQLTELLIERKDEFLSGDEYIRQWSYVVDSTGTVPYTN